MHGLLKVKTWITINEPASICVDTYEYNNGAPGIQAPGIGSYLCGKNVLLAHAKAYRLYRKEFLSSQNGKYICRFLLKLNFQ